MSLCQRHAAIRIWTPGAPAPITENPLTLLTPFPVAAPRGNQPVPGRKKRLKWGARRAAQPPQISQRRVFPGAGTAQSGEAVDAASFLTWRCGSSRGFSSCIKGQAAMRVHLFLPFLPAAGAVGALHASNHGSNSAVMRERPRHPQRHSPPPPCPQHWANSHPSSSFCGEASQLWLSCWRSGLLSPVAGGVLPVECGDTPSQCPPPRTVGELRRLLKTLTTPPTASSGL